MRKHPTGLVICVACTPVWITLALALVKPCVS